MKNAFISFLFIVLLTALWSCDEAANGPKNNTGSSGAVNLQSEMDSASYALGVLIATNNRLKSDDFNIDAVSAGLKDAVNEDLKIELAQCQSTFQAYAAVLQAKQTEAAKKEGEEFLRTNAERDGVVVTESGLQYEVIKSGSGRSPAATDQVEVHYHGTLVDGTVFDSSVDRGQPARIPVNGVITGWIEALQLMKEGDKWKLFIPENLAYGARGQRSIPPYSTLIFEVELISIVE